MELTQIILADSGRYPNFLDPDTIEGHKSMEFLNQVFLWIGQLDQNIFLDEFELEHIKNYLEIYLDRIHRTAGTKVYLKSRDWVRFRMMSYMKFSKENELYEQLSNLQKVFKIIFP
jgi:hypothetical protein